MTPLKKKPDLLRGPYPWIGVFILLFALHLTAASPEFGGNIGGDAVVYYLLGKALATGQGYVDLYLPGNPVHTQYPFLFPLLLAPFHLLFKNPLFPMHVMVSGFSAAAAVFLGMWVAERKQSRRVGLIFALLFGTIPAVYMQSLHLLTEPIYMAFFSLLFFLLARPVKNDLPGPRLLAIVLAALAVYFTRSAGVAAVAAAAAGLFLAKRSVILRGRRVPAWAPLLAAFAVGAGAWYLRNSLLAGKATPYAGQFWAIDPLRPQAGSIGVSELVARVIANFGFFGPTFAGQIIGPLRFRYSDVPGLICLVPVAAGIVRSWGKGGREAEIFYLLSAAIVLVWPFQESRFLIPLAPLSLFFLAEGIGWGAEKIAGRERAGKCMAVLLALFVAGQAAALQADVRGRLTPRPEPRKPLEIKGFGTWTEPSMDFAHYDLKYDLNDPSTYGAVKVFSQYLVINSVAGRIVPPGSVVISRKPMWTYFLSGRKSVPVLHDPDPVAQWRYIVEKRADYIVIGLEERGVYPAIKEAVNKRDGSMRVEAMIDDLGASVIRIDRSLAPPAARENAP